MESQTRVLILGAGLQGAGVALELDKLHERHAIAEGPLEQAPRRGCLDDDRGIGPAIEERPNQLDGARCVTESVARDVEDNRI